MHRLLDMERHRLAGVRGFEVPSWRALAAGLRPRRDQEEHKLGQHEASSTIEQEHLETFFREGVAQVSRRFWSWGSAADVSNMSSHSFRPCFVPCVVVATSTSPFAVVLPWFPSSLGSPPSPWFSPLSPWFSPHPWFFPLVFFTLVFSLLVFFLLFCFLSCPCFFLFFPAFFFFFVLGPPSPGPPSPDRPKFRVFFSPLPPDFSFFLSSLSSSALGRRGFSRQPENSETCVFEAPALQTPKLHDKTLQREERTKIVAGGRKKSAKFWRPSPPFGEHPFFWVRFPHPSWTYKKKKSIVDEKKKQCS